MRKNIFLILIIVTVGIIFLIWRLFFYIPPTSNFIDLKISNTTYKIELAETMAQKIKGLSGRESLCKKCGMLFVFELETEIPFWMKDTLIPIDMIWIDRNGKVVDIQTALETNSEKLYRNKTPAIYVLELNANDSQKLGLKTGDIIQLPNTL